LEESQENQDSQGSKSKNPLMLGLIAVTLISVFGAIYLNQRWTQPKEDSITLSNQSVQGSETEVEEVSLVEPTEPLVDSSKTTVEIEAGSFFYDPREIRVKKGTKVEIVLTAKDMMHDFNIDELGVKLPITQAGNTNTLEFVADTVGEFEYYCSVGQHRSLGQVGTLIVEE
jgi:heme/copper-type cytochrome/quinol oxidase subunit 2